MYITRCDSWRTKKEILIVEDSPTVVEHIKIMLKNSNVKVFNAGSEFGMMQSIESYGKLVDLILMDLTLKTENGMDLIRNLRANDKYKKLPVIIITEHVSKDLILEARNLEVRGYLKSPSKKTYFLIGSMVSLGMCLSFLKNRHRG